jgi:putative toxin-antitoxin system antitoxin component (TIGR02293 family)
LSKQALKLFEGDAEAARRWLTMPAVGLNGHSPIEFAQSDAGAKVVMDMMHRLEHGVFF